MLKRMHEFPILIIEMSEPFNFIAHTIHFIIRYNMMRYSKLMDNMISKELQCIIFLKFLRELVMPT